MEKSKRYTRIEMFAHYEAWLKSNKTQKDYCLNQGLSYYTFKYWSARYKRANHEKPTKPGFIPVKVKPNPEYEVQTPTGQLHFLFPNGVQMRCPETIDSNLLKHLINS
ncbi:MAG: IS66 family insertion sequence element accessory protein TnpA [Bacteroidota bacterium]